MIATRDVPWEGFRSARDLGGLPTRTGGSSRPGAFIRSAEPRFVTAAGWHEAWDAGVRTVVDLRNDDEVARGGRSAVVWMDRVHVALDDAQDPELWRSVNDQGLNGTPLYFRPFLDRKPKRCAVVLTAIARAVPGGVLFHCAGGRDTTVRGAVLETLERLEIEVYLRMAGVAAADLAAIRGRLLG